MHQLAPRSIDSMPIHAHKAPTPEPMDDPLPGEHPVPQEEPVPSPKPERRTRE